MRQPFGNTQKDNTLVFQTFTPVFEWFSILDENLVRKMAKCTAVCVDLQNKTLKAVKEEALY